MGPVKDEFNFASFEKAILTFDFLLFTFLKHPTRKACLHVCGESQKSKFKIKKWERHKHPTRKACLHACASTRKAILPFYF